MYIVGVDGGGTKTHSALATIDGEILETFNGGPSNPRNEGVSFAVETVVSTIAHYQKKINSLCVGLPAVAEEFSDSIEDIEKVLRQRLASYVDEKTKIVVVSDQQIAFRSGSSAKNGVVAIAGTGSVVRGWNNGEDFKSGGWGWIVERSGALYIGKEAWRVTVEALDGRREATSLTRAVMDFFNTNNINDVNKVLYSRGQAQQLAPLSVITSDCAQQGDEVAKKIIADSAQDLANSLKSVVRKLDFKEEFPLVLVGSMFKSPLFKSVFIELVDGYSSFARVIFPKEPPVRGAVLIAKDNLNNE